MFKAEPYPRTEKRPKFFVVKIFASKVLAFKILQGIFEIPASQGIAKGREGYTPKPQHFPD